MVATVGPGDVAFILVPRAELLRQLTGVEPVAAGTHVVLTEYGIRWVQRLAIGEEHDRIVAALWPAELKRQALFLYGGKRGRTMMAKAEQLGWTVTPSLQLAFRNSAASQRLYLTVRIAAAEYARRWEDEDLARVGAYSRTKVTQQLWPWLKHRSYADNADDDALAYWLEHYLGKRDVFLRPGLRFKRRLQPDLLGNAGERSERVRKVRDEVDAILAAAGDPPLPASRSGR